MNGTRTPRLLLATLALFVTTAVAGRYEDQVRSGLADIYNKMPGAYSRLNDLRDIATLDEGENATVSYTLNGGYDYAIVGVCDNDCSDVDLELRDENNNFIDSDTRGNDTPVVYVTPRYRGKFTLKVMMRDCANRDGCVYGVDVYRK